MLRVIFMTSCLLMVEALRTKATPTAKPNEDPPKSPTTKKPSLQLPDHGKRGFRLLAHQVSTPVPLLLPTADPADVSHIQKTVYCARMDISEIMVGINNLGTKLDDLKKDVQGIGAIKNEVISIGAKMDRHRNNTDGIIEKNYNKIDNLIVKDITKVENKLEKIYQTVHNGVSEKGCSSDDIAKLKSSVDGLIEAVKRVERSQAMSMSNVARVAKTVAENSEVLRAVQNAVNSQKRHMNHGSRSLNSNGGDIDKVIESSRQLEGAVHDMVNDVGDIKRILAQPETLGLFQQRDSPNGLPEKKVQDFIKHASEDLRHMKMLVSSHFSEIQQLFASQTKNLDAFWRSIMAAIYQHHQQAFADTKNELKKFAGRSLCPN